MLKDRPATAKSDFSPNRRVHLAVAAMLLCTLSTGCAAITNPVANGIPVRLLPPEVLDGPRREDLHTIPLTLLRQPPPKTYKLAPGDVLGVFVDGVLPATAPDQVATNPPVYFPSQLDPVGEGLPPSLGYPIPVRDDGTISLPLVDPINVDGKSALEASELVREAYLDKGIAKPGRERIFVTLLQPRQYRISVVRQETGGFAQGGRGDIAAGSRKRGTGQTVVLRAYENDVLNALLRTGGLPGLDVYDEIVVFKSVDNLAHMQQSLESLSPDQRASSLSSMAGQVVRIPTRIPPHGDLPFGKNDIVLETGDVVFLEMREFDVYYTGGLLPATEQLLPRDRDLDVIEAIATVGGSLFNGTVNANNLSGSLVTPGIGNPSATNLAVIRRAPDDRQIVIQVDLARAMRDPRERILVRPGDILVLQETPGEAVSRYFSQVFKAELFFRWLNRGDALGTGTLLVP